VCGLQREVLRAGYSLRSSFVESADMCSSSVVKFAYPPASARPLDPAPGAALSRPGVCPGINPSFFPSFLSRRAEPRAAAQPHTPRRAASHGADPRQGERGRETPTAELGKEASVACSALSAGRGQDKACWLAAAGVPFARYTARRSGRPATIHVHIATRASRSAGEAAVCSRVRSARHGGRASMHDGPAAPSWDGPSGTWLDRRIGRG